jgi:hypothetical protein
VTGTDANNCSNTAQVIVKVNPLPTISITASTDSVCDGNPITLSSTGILSPLWNNGVLEGQSFIPTLSKYYMVSGSNMSGCSNSDSILITVNPLPAAPLVTANLPNPICVNSALTLTATNTGGTITWNGPSSFTFVGNTITVSVDSSANYSANETNTSTGCVSDTSNYTIISDPCLSLNQYKKDNIAITIAPNPAYDYIQVISESKIEKITIYTSLGKRILESSGNDKSIRVSELKAGLYTVVSIVNNQRIQKKIVIE